MEYYSVIKKNNHVKVKVTQSVFETPWTTQSMEFSRQDYWSGLPCTPPRDLPNPGSKPRSPALQEDSLPSEPPWKPKPPPQFSSVQSLSHVLLFATP